VSIAISAALVLGCVVRARLFESATYPAMWLLPAIPIAIGVMLLVAHRLLRPREERTRAVPLVIVAMTVAIAGTTVVGTILPNYALARAVRDRNYQVVEGIIMDFHPQLPAAREYERFTVGGVPFEYTQSDFSIAFNHTAANRGPIHPGLHVRVGHVGGRIVTLDECF